MIDYKLALALKKAGFDDLEGLYCKIHKRKWGEKCPLKTGCLAVDLPNPTLSELIEACNPLASDDFNLGIRGEFWEAKLFYVGYFDCWKGQKPDKDKFFEIEIKCEGKSPEEAVAKLWLKLNE